MPESASEQSIKVTADERVHPAIRKLARAMLALARLEVGQSGPQLAGDTPAAGSEVGHD